MSAQQRRYIIAAVAVVIVLFWCYTPFELQAEGGGWYTTFSSHFPEAGGTITLYRIIPLGVRVRVVSRATVRHFYPPDCIVYQHGNASGVLYAACGNRVPVRVASWNHLRDPDGYAIADDGLRMLDAVTVVDGRPLARFEVVSLADIRRVAEAQPVFYPGWQLLMRQRIALQPTVTDEPISVNARIGPGRLPLVEAARRGERDVVEALLNHGADINAADVTGRTAIVAAAREEHADVFRLLLSRGADPCRGVDGNAARNIITWVTSTSELESLAIAAFGSCRNP
jgi:hypothetical protein